MFEFGTVGVIAPENPLHSIRHDVCTIFLANLLPSLPFSGYNNWEEDATVEVCEHSLQQSLGKNSATNREIDSRKIITPSSNARLPTGFNN